MTPRLLPLLLALAACGPGTGPRDVPRARPDAGRCEALRAERTAEAEALRAARAAELEREAAAAPALAPEARPPAEVAPPVAEPEEPALAAGAEGVAAAAVPFETLCPFEWTTELVLSLERALIARGLLAGPADGAYDAALGEAVRAVQAPLGIDSPVLSLEAARALGLARLGPDQLRAL